MLKLKVENKGMYVFPRMIEFSMKFEIPVNVQ